MKLTGKYGVQISTLEFIIQRIEDMELALGQLFINVMPTILGGGIRLFDGLEKERKLKLIRTKSYNGITDLIYERR